MDDILAEIRAGNYAVGLREIADRASVELSQLQNSITGAQAQVEAVQKSDQNYKARYGQYWENTIVTSIIQ